MKYFSAAQFKSAVKSGHKPEDCLLTKASIGVPEVTDDRTVKFTISTDAVDRDNDVIDQKGWKLDNFRKNPVVLWAHKSDDPPIGKVVGLGVEDGALKALVEFVPADNPFNGAKAEGILQMCKAGFVNATSVGFMPIDYEPSDDKSRGGDGWNPGFDIKRQELYELSIVPIPANAEALIEPTNFDSPKSIPADVSKQNLNNNQGERRVRVLRYLELYGAI